MGADEPFDVDVRAEGARAVVAPRGELDISTVGRLAGAMRSADGAAEVVGAAAARP